MRGLQSEYDEVMEFKSFITIFENFSKFFYLWNLRIWKFGNFLSNWELKNLEIYMFEYLFLKKNLKIVKFLILKYWKSKIWNLEIRDWKLKDFIIYGLEDSKTYPIQIYHERVALH